ncbi:MAG: hypothetical protein N3F08_03535 [Crenarchaeota archaeon]|nr:hypothetical protein [Thermoproteota archaeon]
MEFGCFAELVLEDSEEKKKAVLKRYFETIIIKDVERRFNIREREKLEFLVFIFLLTGILFSGFGSQPRHVCKSCGSSQNQGFVSAYIGTYDESSGPSIELNELKGKEKEEALKMLLKTTIPCFP